MYICEYNSTKFDIYIVLLSVKTAGTFSYLLRIYLIP